MSAVGRSCLASCLRPTNPGQWRSEIRHVSTAARGESRSCRQLRGSDLRRGPRRRSAWERVDAVPVTVVQLQQVGNRRPRRVPLVNAARARWCCRDPRSPRPRVRSRDTAGQPTRRDARRERERQCALAIQPPSSPRSPGLRTDGIAGLVPSVDGATRSIRRPPPPLPRDARPRASPRARGDGNHRR
jgi:hypothetical protein